MPGPSASQYADVTTTTRRTALGSIATILLLSVAATACSSDAKKSTPATTTAAPATTTSTSATTVPPATTTPTSAAPTDPLATAVWPSSAAAVRYHDPVASARAFATSYLKFVNPVVGAFQQGDSRSGEVEIRPSSSGPVTTVFVRQLLSDDTWWVLGAATAHIVVTEPAALAAITSPVRLRGSSTAFEATVQVSIRQDNSDKPLADGYVMGGANGQMGPFDTTLKFASPTSTSGALVLYTVSAADGKVSEAAVMRIRFATT